MFFLLSQNFDDLIRYRDLGKNSSPHRLKELFFVDSLAKGYLKCSQSSKKSNKIISLGACYLLNPLKAIKKNKDNLFESKFVK